LVQRHGGTGKGKDKDKGAGRGAVSNNAIHYNKGATCRSGSLSTVQRCVSISTRKDG